MIMNMMEDDCWECSTNNVIKVPCRLVIRDSVKKYDTLLLIVNQQKNIIFYKTFLYRNLQLVTLHNLQINLHIT